MKRLILIFLLASIGTVALFLLNVFYGAVDIPVSSVWNILCGNGDADASWRFIVLESRLPQAVTALLCGGALSVCGLMLQAVFRNPLADPSILGISSGAGLGVALVMLLLGGNIAVGNVALGGFVAVLSAAFVGALLVTAVMFFLSSLMRSNAMLLVAGVMVGYLTSSAVMLLNFFASEDGAHSFMVWGMGNFSSVSLGSMPFFGTVCVVCLLVSVLLVKPLNILVLGVQYAANLGVNTRRLRNTVLVTTGMLTAVTTAFCGPVSFLGLAVPHVARMLTHTDDYRLLLPATVIVGAMVALMCNVVCNSPANGMVLPVNVITPIVGAPVIIYVMLRRFR